MIRIEVKAAEFSTETRGQYTFYEQVAYAHVSDRNGRPAAYPRQIKLQLDKKKPEALPVGMYTLAPQSIFVGKYDALSLAPVLVPVK